MLNCNWRISSGQSSGRISSFLAAPKPTASLQASKGAAEMKKGIAQAPSVRTSKPTY